MMQERHPQDIARTLHADLAEMLLDFSFLGRLLQPQRVVQLVLLVKLARLVARRQLEILLAARRQHTRQRRHNEDS